MVSLCSSQQARAGLALAVLAAASVASAANLEFDFTVPSTQTTFSTPVSLSQFNPSLGTLTSVTFGFKNTMATQISLGNLSSSSTNSLTGTVNGSFTFKDSGSNTLLSSSLMAQAGSGINGQGAFAIRPSGTVGNYFAAPYGGVFSPTVVDASTVTNSLSSSLFAPYKGTGSLNYTYGATALGVTTGPNGVSPANYIDSYTTNASATGYVIYTYTPAPEPGSIAAIGLGLVAVVRRRKGGRR